MVEISNITPRIIPQSHCLYISHIDESGTSSKGFQLRYPMTSFPEVDKVITIEHYNELRKLLKVTAYMLRFIQNLKTSTKRNKERDRNGLLSGPLSIDELKNAERCWVMVSQRDIVSNSKQMNNSLGLRVNNEFIIVCKGCLEKADFPETQIHPI